jgi:nitrate reductase NapD
MAVTRRSLLRGPSSPDTGASAINICSLVVHARPERLPFVLETLSRLPGVETHGASPVGRIVVTIETADDHELVQTMGSIGELPGVLSTALIFQHSESETSS